MQVVQIWNLRKYFIDNLLKNDEFKNMMNEEVRELFLQ